MEYGKQLHKNENILTGTDGGRLDSYLVISKNRLAPIKRMSIDLIELFGTVLNKRLKQLMERVPISVHHVLPHC